MSDLSPAARSLIDAAKGAEMPGVEDKLRVQDALYAKLGLGAAVGAAVGAASAGGAAGPSTLMHATSASNATGASAIIGTGVASGAGITLAAKVGLTVVAVLGLTIGGYYAFRSPGSAESGKTRQAQAAPSLVSTSAIEQHVDAAKVDMAKVDMTKADMAVGDAPSKKPAAITEDTAPTKTVVSRPSPPAVVKRVRQRKQTRRNKAKPAKVEKVTPINSLLEEKRLLTAAQRAQRDGDAQRALQLLSTHAKKFPNGILAPERNGTRVLALCQLGRKAAAKAAAARFLRNSSRHPMAARVRRSCGN